MLDTDLFDRVVQELYWDPSVDEPGGKFCCTIWLAVRVEKALPALDR